MDTRRLLLFSLAAALLGGLVSRPARAQTAKNVLRFTWRAPATGARMIGLAGAGIAGFADYAMLYANPAGLGYFETSQAAGAFGVLLTRDESRYLVDLRGTDEYQPGPREPTFAEETETGYTGNLALVYTFPTTRGSLVFAGAYNRVRSFQRTLEFEGVNPFNSITDTFLPTASEYGVDSLGVFFPTEQVLSSRLPFIAYRAGAIEFRSPACPAQDGYPFCQAVTPGTVIGQTGTVSREGGLNEISLGAAVEASRGFMLGLSLNVAFGAYRFENFYVETDIRGENTPPLYVIPLDGDTLRGFQALEFRESFESELTGANLRAGLSAMLSPSVRVGVTLETPTFYQVSETYTIAAITTFFDVGGSLSYGNRPDDVGRGTFDYEIHTPWRLGAGVSVNTAAFTEGALDLTLLADAEVVDWSQLEIEAQRFDFPEVNRRLEDLEVVVNTHVGAELRIGEAALRAGFAHQPDPRDYEILLPENETTDRSRTYYTAGFSYRINEQIQIDLAWSQLRFEDQYRPYPSVDVPGSSVEITPPYVDEDIIRNKFLVGLRYSF